jgi:hypothetical protein
MSRKSGNAYGLLELWKEKEKEEKKAILMKKPDRDEGVPRGAPGGAVQSRLVGKCMLVQPASRKMANDEDLRLLESSRSSG